MLAALMALKARSVGLGYETHLGMVPGPTVPAQYVVLRAPSADTDGDRALADAGSYDAPVFVTAATGTVEGVFKMLDRLRDTLPGLLAVDGRRIEVVWEASEVEPELDLTLTRTETNQHPAYGVERYRVYSQPA